MIGGEDGVAAEWAAPGLPGEQAQVVAVQRWFDLASPLNPVVPEVGSVHRRASGDSMPEGFLSDRTTRLHLFLSLIHI